jgi:hypothetical protein
MIVEPMAEDKLEERSPAPVVSWLIRPKWGRMRALFIACLMTLIIGIQSCTAAAAHEGWFVRVCPYKTEANRIHLTFSGGRQGFNWSWIRGRTPDETDLPRKFRSVTRLDMRGSAAARRRCRAICNLTPMSVSGSGIISFSVWNSTTTRTTKRIGVIPMIVDVKAA